MLTKINGFSPRQSEAGSGAERETDLLSVNLPTLWSELPQLAVTDLKSLSFVDSSYHGQREGLWVRGTIDH
ncbi:hypothetical protein RRG08_004065 [Elysia crispata]|uniref:Uncharacterized protein n=1 Tax=Elysia crispata TaxID=231223 RepID=A0AAE1DZ74_9GAST|nr:hypothetical protein RRG08_004065 [Elysia crispata]